MKAVSCEGVSWLSTRVQEGCPCVCGGGSNVSVSTSDRSCALVEKLGSDVSGAEIGGLRFERQSV